MTSFIIGTVFGGLLANLFFLSGKRSKVAEYLNDSDEPIGKIAIPRQRMAQIINLRTPAEKALESNE